MIVSRRARYHPVTYAQGTLIACMHIGLHACVGQRRGYGVDFIPPLDAITYSLFVFWVGDSNEYPHMSGRVLGVWMLRPFLVLCGTTRIGFSS